MSLNSTDTLICVKGLDRAVGGRCFLEVLVLRHSLRHNVFMETICKQPKVSSSLGGLDSHFCFSLLRFIDHLMSAGMLSHLSLTTLMMRRLRSSSPLQTLVWLHYGSFLKTINTETE